MLVARNFCERKILSVTIYYKTIGVFGRKRSRLLMDFYRVDDRYVNTDKLIALIESKSYVATLIWGSVLSIEMRVRWPYKSSLWTTLNIKGNELRKKREDDRVLYRYTYILLICVSLLFADLYNSNSFPYCLFILQKFSYIYSLTNNPSSHTNVEHFIGM